MVTPLRVAVVARSELVRHGVAGLIGMDPTRAVVVDTVEHDGHLGHHDVVVYDLSGLTNAGADLQHLLRTNGAVVGLVPDARDDLAEGALRMGVSRVVSMDITAAGLLTVLEQVARGTDRRHVPAAPSDPQHPGVVDGTPWGLSAREVDILTLIGQGRRNLDIAAQLYLSENSVKSYIRTAYRKIGVKTRSQAVLWVVQHGLVRNQR